MMRDHIAKASNRRTKLGARAVLAAGLMLAAALAGCVGRPPAEPPPDPRPRDLRVTANIGERVLLLMEKHRVPGVALAILEDGSLRSSEGFGYTDATRTRRAEPSTVFEAASLGKPLFAYMVVQRALLGQVDLDSPVKGAPDDLVAGSPEGAGVTPAHLLSHTSGLGRSPQDGWQLATRPGAEWRYSGLGFFALQQALERSSGKSLDALVEETITGPLGMKHTSYSIPGPDSGSAAKGHDRQGRERPRTAPAPANAASSLRSTVVDYARFVERMFADLAPSSGTTTAGRKMLEPRVQVDATSGLSWGLGWGIARTDGEVLFLQWGSNRGYKALALASVDRRKAMVILTNGDDGLELATELVPLVFGRDYPFLRFYMLHPDD